MRKLLPMLATAAAFAAPLDAQVGRQLPPLQVPPVRSEAPAAPVGGSSFQAACVAITHLWSSGFKFECRQADGTTVEISVATSADVTGEHGVGFEQTLSISEQDEVRLIQISQTVVAFLLYKTLRPASDAVLQVYGMHSRLAIAKAAPVAMAVHFAPD